MNTVQGGLACGLGLEIMVRSQVRFQNLPVFSYTHTSIFLNYTHHISPKNAQIYLKKGSILLSSDMLPDLFHHTKAVNVQL